MKSFTVYNTHDGCSFDDEVKALRHENYIYEREIKKMSTEINELSHMCNDLKESLYKKSKKDKTANIPSTSGVYMLINPYDSCKKYIGSTNDLKHRYQSFLTLDRRYGGKKINDARNVTPPNEWLYTILEFCEEKYLNDRENYYINMFDTITNGYNSVLSCRINNDDTHSVDKKDKMRSNSAWKSFNDSICRKTPERKHDIQREDFINKRNDYQNRYKDKKLYTDYRINTFNKSVDYVLKIEDITFIPVGLSSLILPRTKRQRNGLLTGVVYNVTLGKYTTCLDPCKNLYGGYFENEYDAYIEMLKYKREKIVNWIENNKDMVDESVYNILRVITIEQLEKLIVFC